MDHKLTGWTNVYLVFARQYIKLLLSKDQRPGAPTLTNESSHWHGDARFSWLEDNDLLLRCRHCLFLTCSCRDYPIFSRNVTCDTCSNRPGGEEGNGPPEGKFMKLSGKVNFRVLSSKLNAMRAKREGITLLLANKTSFSC